MSPLSKTVFKLVFGQEGYNDKIRYFKPEEFNDATQQFSYLVNLFNSNHRVLAAHVSLCRLPDSVYPDGMSLVAWTKMDGEREVNKGTDNLEDVL